jgi:4-alpha-glucanotransferase
MSELLHHVARLYRIQTEYRDGFGQQRRAPAEAILKVLQTLDAPVESFEDLPGALRERRQTLWQRAIEPVTIAWQAQLPIIQVRLPSRLAEAPVLYEIMLESGEVAEGACSDAPGFTPRMKEVEGATYVTRRLLLSAAPPLGYHRLRLRIADLELESQLFSAPLEAYAPAEDKKFWGIFCPLYSLHSERSWGAGDFSDLVELIEFTAELKGHAAGTLPILASFLDEPFNPSPYAPVSRLFWNELYLDVERVPELAHSPKAQAILDSEEFRRDLATVRARSLVDYRKTAALKRRMLTELCGSLLNGTSARKTIFEHYVAAHPLARDYAAFRAAVEHAGKTWTYWQPASRDGQLTSNDYERRAQDYHLYVQWLCAEQIRTLSNSAKARGTVLYLDFPLGVNRDGYDVWRQQQLFALPAAAGAPPDGLFVKGQNWGFPPLHPEALRAQGYRYPIDCLRHHMSSAGMLRVDHVMGLHRAFWIPEGFSATDGMYVRYRAPELYAIFNLESQRHGVRIVGENLGTVPDYVNEALARHKFLGMHVGQFGVDADPAAALQPTPRQTMASLNTHDTATFMGFWSGGDIQDRLALNLIDATQALDEHRYRATQRQSLVAFLHTRGYMSEATADADMVLHAWLKFLADQGEEFLLVNLEDLWLEPSPQNVPGTWEERPNWQRKARFSIAEIRARAPLMALLKTISDKRSPIS